MLKTVLALLLLLLVGVSSASAYLTSAEYTSMVAFLTISSNLGSAWLELGGSSSKLIEQSTTTNNSRIRDAWTNMANARAPFARAVAYLWNVNPDTSGAACGATRAACVASAVTQIAALRVKLAAAQTAFTELGTVNGCGGSNCGSADFRTTATAGANWLGTAIAAIDGTWNPALTYTDPWNDWYKKCIAVGVDGCTLGPHGRFNLAVFTAVEAAIAADAGEDAFRQAWDWVANSETVGSATHLAAFGRVVFRGGGSVVGVVMNMPLRYNLITTTPTLSPFKSLSAVYENAYASHSASQGRCHCIEGLPYHIDQAAVDAFTALVDYGKDRPVALGYLKTGWHQLFVKMWNRNDGSAWRSMELPSAADLALIRANRSQMNDPHGPPINYYKE